MSFNPSPCCSSIKTSLFLVILIPFFSFAGFTYDAANETITQTGTDDFASFKTFATNNTFADVMGDVIIARSDVKIIVEGTLTFTNCYLKRFSFDIRNGGVLQFGEESYDVGVNGCYVELTHAFSNTGMGSTVSKGEVRIFGSTIVTNANNRIDLGYWQGAVTPKFILNGAILKKLGTGDSSFYSPQTETRGEPSYITDFTRALQNPTDVVLNAPINFISPDIGVAPLSSSGYKLRDINIRGANVAVSNKQQLSLIKGNIEKNDVWFNTDGVADRHANSQVIKYYSLNLKIVDDKSSPIPNARIFIKDKLGGTTPDASGVIGEYSLNSDSSGLVTETLVRKWSVDYNGNNFTDDTGNQKPQSANFTDYDPYSFCILSYHKKIFYTTQMRDYGTNDAPENIFLLPDQDITETNFSTVANYNQINNLDELYDRAKYWKTQNVNSPPIPIDELLFSRAGEESNITMLNDWSLVVDQNAANAFSVDTSSKIVTIKSSELDKGTKFNGIKTQGTGTVSAAGTENLSKVGIYSSNIDSYINFAGVGDLSEWHLYNSLADAEADTSKVASDTSLPMDNYLFKYSGGTQTFGIKFNLGGSILFQEVKVTAAGETKINFSQISLLAAIKESVDKISSSIKYLPNEVFIDLQASTNGDGSHESPYNNLTSAINFARSNNIDVVSLMSNAALNSAANGIVFKGNRPGISLDLNNQNTKNAQFNGLELTGTASGSFNSIGCTLNAVQALAGLHRSATLSGTITIKETAQFLSSHAHPNSTSTPTLSMTGESNIKLSVENYSGNLAIEGSTEASNDMFISSTEINLIIKADNTAGSVKLRGLGLITNNASTGLNLDKIGFYDVKHRTQNQIESLKELIKLTIE